MVKGTFGPVVNNRGAPVDHIRPLNVLARGTSLELVQATTQSSTKWELVGCGRTLNANPKRPFGALPLRTQSILQSGDVCLMYHLAIYAATNWDLSQGPAHWLSRASA